MTATETDIQKNKFSDRLDSALVKAVGFIDRYRGDLIFASFPISIVGHMASLTAQNMLRTPTGGPLAANIILAVGIALTTAIPVALGAVMASSAAKKIAPEQVPSMDIADPLRGWDKKPASVGYSKSEYGINIPGHDSPHKGPKEIDAFSLPELTEIVSSFKNDLSPLQNDKLRDLIGKTRHADHVDEIALPAITAEMATRAKTIFEGAGLSPQKIYDLTALDYLKALEKNDGRELPQVSGQEKFERKAESPQVSI